MRGALVVAALAVSGCGAKAGPPVETPAPAPVADPFSWPALIGTSPASDAPPQLAQFGRLVGVWSCTGEERQQDGTFKGSGSPSTWTWFYTLSGRAVQDIFEPATGATGTNLRIYDADNDAWEIQWTTGALTRFERITAKAVGETIVLHGEVPAGQFAAHARQITFFDITADAFEWKYESTRPGGIDSWTEQARLHCKKTASDPIAR